MTTGVDCEVTMDVHSKQQRSHNMARIKGKNTKPELIVRRLLWHNGCRYQLHRKDLPGKPDIVFPGREKVLFINGCFWHKHDCKYFRWPKTNSEFWRDKIEATVLRDTRNYAMLIVAGWKYLVVWECEIKKKNPEQLYWNLSKFLEKEIIAP